MSDETKPDENGHVWAKFDMPNATWTVCRRCGWFRGGPKSKEPCKPARVAPRKALEETT